MLQKLPIGIQTFERIREDGYLYVDKTMYCKRLFDQGKYLFLSRPRRFGKSLLLSTLKAIFEGKKHLFQGLAIENEVDWQPVPVIFIDFNALDYHQFPLQEELEKAIEHQAALHQITLVTPKGAKAKFTELLHRLGRAVVLMDEYDKPISDFLGKPQAADNAEVLKSFYSALKAQDAFIHFCCLTGVSKLGKVSIFSDLNNLQDLTLHEDFAAIAGITQTELEHYFSDYLPVAAERQQVSAAELLTRLKRFYNGYAWKIGDSVYCPFSVLNFFASLQLRNFWFDTGTPTFLTKLIREKGISPISLEWRNVGASTLQSTNFERVDIVSLLFQTGYLTLKQVEYSPLGQPSYVLGYPNEEVRQSISLHLLSEYTQLASPELEQTIAFDLKKAIVTKDWPSVINFLNSLLSNIPYQIAKPDEAWLHSIVHIAFSLTGLQVISEYSTINGRVDTVLLDTNHILIVEYKLGHSAQDALTQILNKNYTLPFESKGLPIFGLGIAFDGATKQISDWVIQEINK